jgi:hypothetical protein
LPTNSSQKGNRNSCKSFKTPDLEILKNKEKRVTTFTVGNATFGIIKYNLQAIVLFEYYKQN